MKAIFIAIVLGFANSSLATNLFSIADDQVMSDLGDSPRVITDSNHDNLLPTQWDWRSIGGTDFVAPAGDQGDCGSCVAFAMLATLETQINIAKNTPYSPFTFSRQFVFSCGGGVCAKGWLLSEAVNYLAENGAPDSACMEYQSGLTGKDVSCSLACQDSSDRSMRIAGYEKITKGVADIAKIKAALMKGPVLSSMILFADFLSYKSGVYRHREGINRGSHAVMIVGWDDAKQAWIARNSMGTKWGMSGDFYIAYDDESLIGRYTYQFKLVDTKGFVAIENLSASASIKGSHSITLHSAFANTSRIEVFAVENPSDIFSTRAEHRHISIEVPGSVDGVVDIESTIDSQRLEDGTYFFYGAAHHAEGTDFTQPVRVEVRNARVQINDVAGSNL